MGLFDFAKRQFINVISWSEEGDGTLEYRFPVSESQIQNGAQLTVRDSQLALLVNEGQPADVYAAGLHTLNTHNMPVLTSLKNWDKAFESPFKADVYFFSTREQLNQKWGTPQPITVRDKDYGPLRIRAFGTFSYAIQDASVFYKKVSGTREIYSASELEPQLVSGVTTAIATFLGHAEMSFVDMAANQAQFSSTIKTALESLFSGYGLDLRTFFVQSLSLPENLQAAMDSGSSMRLIGDLHEYAKFQAAESLPLAAQNPSGLAGAGVGLGAGLGLGQAFAAALSPEPQHAPPAPEPSAPSMASSAPVSNADDVVAMIEKIHELFKKGILSQAEFENKKAELLKKI